MKAGTKILSPELHMSIKMCFFLMISLILISPCSTTSSQIKNQCKVITGTPHELFVKREGAVYKGILWMEEYLSEPTNFEAIGLDSVCIFLELAVCSRSERVRSRSMTIARRFARKMEQTFLENNTLEGTDLIDAIDLLAECSTLGMDPQPLLKKIQPSLKKYAGASALIGIQLTNLNTLSEEQIFDMMMYIYDIEKAKASFPGLVNYGFSLRQVMQFLRDKKLMRFHEDTNPDKNVFFNHAYLATHIVYVFTNYGRLPFRKSYMPNVIDYLRSIFYAALLLKDIELVGEIVDVFRSMGFNETNDYMVEAGTRFLLDAQADDGSWGKWREAGDPYSAIHFTWCAVGALRDRVTIPGTAYEKKIKQLVKELR
jgi:hypothetical protein